MYISYLVDIINQYSTNIDTKTLYINKNKTKVASYKFIKEVDLVTDTEVESLDDSCSYALIIIHKGFNDFIRIFGYSSIEELMVEKANILYEHKGPSTKIIMVYKGRHEEL